MFNSIRPLALVAALALPMAGHAYEEEVASTNLPPIWEDASGNQMVSAVKAAEELARRNFAARVKGIRIDGVTTVNDIVQANNRVSARLNDFIRGIKFGEPTFKDDGRVQVVAKGTVRDIITTIEKEIETDETWSGRIRREEFTEITQEIRDTIIEEVGQSAIPGSLGEKRLRWLMLARLDALTKLVGRIEGVQVTAESKVGDFLLKSDQVRSRVSSLLSGATVTKVKFDQKFVEVEMTLKMEEIIETITYTEFDGETEKSVDQQVRELVFTEKGIGSEDGAPKDVKIDGTTNPSDITSIVIQRVVSRRTVSH